jgi:peptide/nickel transport system ATP-binding protein
MRKISGNEIAMIFQEPMTSLNPVEKCGWQVQEAILLHQKCSRKEAKKRTIELFEKVNFLVQRLFSIVILIKFQVVKNNA